MHAYPNHCVLSETEKYNGALEITKYSNFSSTVIKEEKSTTSPILLRVIVQCHSDIQLFHIKSIYFLFCIIIILSTICITTE